ncbi:MAG: sensor histidine kinase [Planktomarina sp.]|uniref:sensor histidine kinase n=1 Tax=Planktomarina sp. TaxID=2024851 RepID=UPI003260EFA5|nr:sensor histidine kinase [Planktomarina sp.]
MSSVTENSETLAPRVANLSWRVRIALLTIFLIGVGTVYFTNQLLTARFTQSTLQRAQLRLALYSGNMVSELQRNSIVPRLLSSDAELVGALSSRDYQRTSLRLLSFVDEIGAAAILLLDLDGRVVAATDRNRLGEIQSNLPHFVEAARASETVFTTHQMDSGGYDFAYSRRVVANNKTLGVIVVEVDLRKFQSAWAGISDAVIVSLPNGPIVLATEKTWIGLPEEEALALRSAPSAIERAIRATQDWTALPADAYVQGRAVMRRELRVPFRGWTMVLFTTYGGIRQRVNAVLALEIMGFSILFTLAFYQLSRQTLTRALFFQQESDDLRQLNLRLQREISERQKVEKNLQVAEQTLAQSSKLAALGEMSAAVSHELNQPLAAMKTYLAGAKLLLQRKRMDEALSSFQRIDDLIGRMSAITRQLKSYARKGGDDLVPVDVRAALNGALEIMEPQLKSRQVSLSTSVPNAPVMILGDQLRLEQVVVNLLRNALDATSMIDAPEIELLLIGGETATLTVRDNGEGISDLDDLFEPFFTTKKPGDGVGLGLAISSGIVSDLGGRLVARNSEQSGAVFEVTLPIIDNHKDEE